MSVRIENTASCNRLLTRLPPAARAQFVAACERVELAAGQVLLRAGQRVTHAWFPLDAVLSVSLAAEERRSIAVALVGREGMLGIPLLLDANQSEWVATVARPGAALRIEAAALRLQLVTGSELEKRLRHYVLASIAQLARAVLCTHYHQVDQRLARLLLMQHDRAPDEPLHVTHEMLAATLGARRAGVTRAAHVLQLKQLIAYHRGVVTILDRDGLQRAACACYAADCASYAALMRRHPAC
ncbi:Crp/Fnr family transcriptional regulator [Ramlibacter ginsenosidimutans]|uniref:Crp/Fnr family transcriptional regulator n=1 Tax=Ramlibacter ginsenosidimutans TaxID=502333 RepID=A0A934TTT7_9BURK|nr:Crp/Fnr family transcriptional regulator [Ramlibacter ginsenosidimutans]MBK6006901.1 Crp/Fnr family transcriptional regulator [Ramlibacter ginsenosidimutans]